MPGIKVEKLTESIVISRFIRRATSVKTSIWKPSVPPPSLGMACGAKVPSTPVRNGGCLSCASAGLATMSAATAIAARRFDMETPPSLFPPQLRWGGTAPLLDQALLNGNLRANVRPMSERILVINPNSSETVTQGIDAAMEPLRMPGGPAIECVTLKEGPPGIESQAHVEQVVAPIGEMVKKRDNDCSAFV